MGRGWFAGGAGCALCRGSQASRIAAGLIDGADQPTDGGATSVGCWITAVSQPEQVYRLGRHVLVCGDSTDDAITHAARRRDRQK